jgi:hypothetical protein
MMTAVDDVAFCTHILSHDAHSRIKTNNIKSPQIKSINLSGREIRRGKSINNALVHEEIVTRGIMNEYARDEVVK